ncbi:MAG: ACT domain-containing protein [Candidatus Micrarchaeota archaeon]|nr:ACT domain-containing protein [Candidatus Micrarchaeota archaeon]
MEKNTAELTNEYIDGHPYVKNCLKKGLINYSALARHIAKELGIGKESSKEAIMIAAIRARDRLRKELAQEREILDLLSKSEIEIKNKMVVFILEKGISFDLIENIEAQIKKESGLSYVLEGSNNYTLITQGKFAQLIKEKLKYRIMKIDNGMVLINIKSQKEIETIPGVISYLTSLFAENGVNIYEFLSCWTDTIFIIDSKDLNKAINFLRFE